MQQKLRCQILTTLRIKQYTVLLDGCTYPEKGLT